MSDLISKNALLLSLAEYVNSNAYLNQTALDALLMVMRWVKEDPAVDAVPVVHAKWVWHEERWEHECTNCHCGFDYDKTYLLFDNGYEYASYCPNCGAKMDGGAE